MPYSITGRGRGNNDGNSYDVEANIQSRPSNAKVNKRVTQVEGNLQSAINSTTANFGNVTDLLNAQNAATTGLSQSTQANFENMIDLVNGQNAVTTELAQRLSVLENKVREHADENSVLKNTVREQAAEISALKKEVQELDDMQQAVTNSKQETSKGYNPGFY